MKLILLKDYIKQSKLSESGVRKSIKSNNLLSVEIDNNTYVVIEDKDQTIIKDLKNKVKLLQSDKRELKKELLLYENQKETIIKLETKIDKLETKLEQQTEKKEELYEKVIHHMTNNLIGNNK